MGLTLGHLLFAFNMLVVIISTLALISVNRYCTRTDDIKLPLAPKATYGLHQMLIPPLRSMQLLIWCFDLAVFLYYLWNLPLFDKLRACLPFYQQSADDSSEHKAVKKDKSGYLLNILFNVLSKGLALAICISC